MECEFKELPWNVAGVGDNDNNSQTTAKPPGFTFAGMRIFLRYLTLFVGVVATINGCNGLISSQFGTHRLRTHTADQLSNEGLGDADYLELTGVLVAPVQLFNPPGHFFSSGTIQKPLFTKEQLSAYELGDTVAPLVILWTPISAPAASPPNLLPATTSDTSIRGLVAEPPLTIGNSREWALDRIKINDQTIYLANNQAPMAWYWNLLLFLGGLTLAILPEARRFNQNKEVA